MRRLESFLFISTSVTVIPIQLLADIMIVLVTVQRCPVRGTLYFVIHDCLPEVLAPSNECYLHHWQKNCMVISVHIFTLNFMLNKK